MLVSKRNKNYSQGDRCTGPVTKTRVSPHILRRKASLFFTSGPTVAEINAWYQPSELRLWVHCGPVLVQAQVKDDGWWRGADAVTVKNRRLKSNGKWRRVNGKHQDMEGEGKGDGHQHGRKPRIPEPVLTPNSQETHIVRKCGNIGHLRALSSWSNGWMDGSTIGGLVYTYMYVPFWTVWYVLTWTLDTRQ